MFKLNVGAVAAATFTALSLVGMNVLAADAPSRNARDLKDNSCKDVMRLSGQDRDVAHRPVHRLLSGQPEGERVGGLREARQVRIAGRTDPAGLSLRVSCSQPRPFPAQPRPILTVPAR